MQYNHGVSNRIMAEAIESWRKQSNHEVRNRITRFAIKNNGVSNRETWRKQSNHGASNRILA